LHDIRGALATVKRHLKSSKLTALYLEAFLLMGGFVTVYNYLGAYITARPYYLPVWIASFAFIAYLAGTVSSPISGRLAERFGRKRIILVGIMGILVGLGVMLVQQLAVIIIGLVIFTASFFAAHSVAAGWRVLQRRLVVPSHGNVQPRVLPGFERCGLRAGFFFEKDGWASLVAALVVVYTVSFVLAWVMLPARPPVQAPDSQKP
jgi:YNFM family putative membrane transporter